MPPTDITECVDCGDVCVLSHRCDACLELAETARYWNDLEAAREQR